MSYANKNSGNIFFKNIIPIYYLGTKTVWYLFIVLVLELSRFLYEIDSTAFSLRRRNISFFYVYLNNHYKNWHRLLMRLYSMYMIGICWNHKKVVKWANKFSLFSKVIGVPKLYTTTGNFVSYIPLFRGVNYLHQLL